MNYESEKDYQLLTELFDEANVSFLKADKDLFYDGVSERTLCGALKRHIENKKWRRIAPQYKVDVEYDRNDGELKTVIVGENRMIRSITCDLILHSRGKIIKQDNLIALEMKKAYRDGQSKTDDKNRLMALTKSSYDDIWSFDGKTLPEHVCRYILGVYYEVDIRR